MSEPLREPTWAEIEAVAQAHFRYIHEPIEREDWFTKWLSVSAEYRGWSYADARAVWPIAYAAGFDDGRTEQCARDLADADAYVARMEIAHDRIVALEDMLGQLRRWVVGGYEATHLHPDDVDALCARVDRLLNLGGNA